MKTKRTRRYRKRSTRSRARRKGAGSLKRSKLSRKKHRSSRRHIQKRKTVKRGGSVGLTGMTQGELNRLRPLWANVQGEKVVERYRQNAREHIEEQGEVAEAMKASAATGGVGLGGRGRVVVSDLTEFDAANNARNAAADASEFRRCEATSKWIQDEDTGEWKGPGWQKTGFIEDPLKPKNWVTQCNKCMKKLRPRMKEIHHCRNCGLIYCKTCLTTKDLTKWVARNGAAGTKEGVHTAAPGKEKKKPVCFGCDDELS